MISLQQDELVIRFPHIEEGAALRIDFQRTLRIPDDGHDYHLPPGLGRFPLRHVEDFDLGNSNHRKTRGGIIMPMFQTDALWLNFSSSSPQGVSLPVALKIGAGKINAVSGEKWSDGLSQDPQSYVVTPDQPWLDGFNVADDKIRQFVAMPLGKGYSVEEQIDPESNVGGMQIEAIPMKAAAYEKIKEHKKRWSSPRFSIAMSCEASPPSEMGLGLGGAMRQVIFPDVYGLDAWDLEKSQRCFVMLMNAEQWMSMTGEEPPLSPLSAKEYSKAGLPWFDYYDADKKVIEGAKALGDIKSVKEIAKSKGEPVWSDEAAKLHYTVKKIKSGNVSGGSW